MHNNLVMKKYFIAICSVVVFPFLFVGCNTKKTDGNFTITGELKNVEPQKIYLEQLFFNANTPQVLDSTTVKDGKFSLSALGKEEGLYRIRFEKVENGFVFINDDEKMNLRADLKDSSLSGPKYNTPANQSLMNFLATLEQRGKEISTGMERLEALKTTPANDSAVAFLSGEIEMKKKDFTSYVISYADTIAHPVLAMFALGYANGAGKDQLDKAVANLTKRFPAHSEVTGMVSRYNEMNKEQGQSQQTPATAPAAGVAPALMMNDTEGKPFDWSALKGKYVLVDFWASWCAPCRGENPNVVAAYNQFKDKNFTVLGVSLDEDKAAWLAAIKKDNLIWQHISDLKGWSSAAVSTYNFNGIPYNVLLDPEGKIIATELRGPALSTKLSEVLK